MTIKLWWLFSFGFQKMVTSHENDLYTYFGFVLEKKRWQIQKSSKLKVTIDYNIQTQVYYDCLTPDSMFMKQLIWWLKKNNFSEERVIF